MGKKIQININKIVIEHNISLRELARLTDINHSILSKLSNGKRQNIHFGHIERIADALNITDIRRIIEIIND